VTIQRARDLDAGLGDNPIRDRLWSPSTGAQRLSPGEIERLLSRRLIASLATIDELGRIHLVPMWYLAIGGQLLFPTSSRTRKARNISLSSIATATVHDARGGPNVRGVMVRGHAEVVIGDVARQLNRKIHRRYMTATGLVQPEVVDLLRADDVTLRLLVEDVVSWKVKAGRSPKPSWSRPLA
jgi:nitroimidazol reductase NimA-like FMN-containing flavoprotein (pyridoxamine 5'-phosphate oxidase superfamily)